MKTTFYLGSLLVSLILTFFLMSPLGTLWADDCCPNREPNEEACMLGPFPQCPITNVELTCLQGVVQEPSDGKFGCKVKDKSQCLPGKAADQAVCYTTYGCKLQVGNCVKDNTKSISNKKVPKVAVPCP